MFGHCPRPKQSLPKKPLLVQSQIRKADENLKSTEAEFSDPGLRNCEASRNLKSTDVQVEDPGMLKSTKAEFLDPGQLKIAKETFRKYAVYRLCCIIYN